VKVLALVFVVYALAWVGAFKQELELQRADAVAGRIPGVSRGRALVTAAAWPAMILAVVIFLIVEGVHDSR
jgi:hypothetical protein